MDRRQLIRSGLLAGAGAFAAPMLNLGRCRLLAEEPAVSTHAVDLVLESTVIDMLGLLTFDWQKLYRWQRAPETFAAADFHALVDTGVGIFHPAVDPGADDPYSGARRWMDGWNLLLASRPCMLERVTASGELTQAVRKGEAGILVGFQNSDHFRTVADVAAFRARGQIVSQLTYNERNRLGSGCHVRRDRGLTPFGAEVVAEMDRVGMAVDVSHCGERTSLEAIAASRRPVLVTHSNCKALVPQQPRCKSDAVIRAMAARGGVMGITAVTAFVGRRAPTISDYLDHFDHVAHLVGVEHVGIGSDVDPSGLDPATGRPFPYYRIAGLSLPLRVFQLADGLLRRGYPDRHVELILGGNFRRALGEVWAGIETPPIPEREMRRDPFCEPAPPITPESLARDGAAAESPVRG
jgi:membrane dipeptidase